MDTDQHSIHPGAIRYPDDVQQLAFELWALKHGQNAAAVSRDLLERGYEVPENRIRDWARKQAWSERKRDRMRELAPAVDLETISELVLGGLEAATYLRSVVRADEEGPADKARVQAAIAMIDRAGYSPVGRSDKLDRSKTGDTRGIYRWLDDAEVQAHIARITAQSSAD